MLVAQIGAPHGVRGEVRIRAFTDDPETLIAYGLLETEDGSGRVKIRRLRPGKGGVIAVIEGMASRDAAEALKNCRLYVPRDALAEPEEDEWYHVDLVGLIAREVGGCEIGTIAGVHDFGAGDLLEVQLTGSRRSVLVPFTREIVPDVDIAGGHVTIDAPAGLLEEADPQNGTERT